MPIYTERWSARPAWLALSVSDRLAYLDEMEASMNALADAGARLLGVVLSEVPRLRCDYVAVWAMPDRGALVPQLEAVLERAGWHRYFQRAAAPSGLRGGGAHLLSRAVAANGRE